MILTLVPNPSLDKVSIVPGFAAGGAFHALQVRRFPGGKGFHFARALRTLGETPLLVCPLGGETGQLVNRLALDEGFACDFFHSAYETRTGQVIFDPQTWRITELYEPGPTFEQDDWQQVAAKVRNHLPESRMLVVCGSIPPGVPDQSVAEIVRQSAELGCPTLLDTYGPHLAAALAARPAVVKINQHEAGHLLQRVIATPTAALDAAARIQAAGAQAVVITLGAQGAVGLSPQGQSFALTTPPVESLFPVGSGDSFFAGLAFALSKGEPLVRAACWGIAAGCANTLSIGPGVLDKSDVLRLLDQVQPLDI